MTISGYKISCSVSQSAALFSYGLSFIGLFCLFSSLFSGRSLLILLEFRDSIDSISFDFTSIFLQFLLQRAKNRFVWSSTWLNIINQLKVSQSIQILSNFALNMMQFGAKFQGPNPKSWKFCFFWLPNLTALHGSTHKIDSVNSLVFATGKKCTIKIRQRCIQHGRECEKKQQ